MSNIKQTIDDNIYQNGQGLIRGDILNNVLKAMVDDSDQKDLEHERDIEDLKTKTEFIEREDNKTIIDDDVLISSLEVPLSSGEYANVGVMLSDHSEKLTELEDAVSEQIEESGEVTPSKLTGKVWKKDGTLMNLSTYNVYVYDLRQGATYLFSGKYQNDSNGYPYFVFTDADGKYISKVGATGSEEITLTDLEVEVPEGAVQLQANVRNLGSFTPLFKLKETLIKDELIYSKELKDSIEKANENIDALSESVKTLSASVSTLETREVSYEKTYTSDDFYVNPTTGAKSYFYTLALSVGDLAPLNPTAFTNVGNNWGCVKFEVKKGQKISIYTIGGSNGRAYAITDVDRKILVVAAAGTNTINNPFVYEVTEDGFCYVNCTKNNNPDFKVVLQTPLSIIVQGEEDLDKRVSALENGEDFGAAPMISNPPIDIRKETKSQLRVLDIGNSFTEDPTSYLNGFITAAGLDVSDMCLYRMTRGGGSFKSFYDSWRNQDTYGGTTDPTCHYSVGKLFGGLSQSINGTTNLEKMHSCFMDCKWDLIIIHQVSTYSDRFNLWNGNTDAGYLTKFIRLVRLYQPQATIGFLMPHASFSQSQGGDTESLFKGIAESVQKMRSAYGIDFIIPVASAIENLRSSQTFKTMYPNVQRGYSRDGHHLGYGLARYVANAVYFQSILGKRYGVSVYGNTYRVSVTTQSTYPNESINVTDANATLAQICAILAYDQMYSINSPDNVESTL